MAAPDMNILALSDVELAFIYSAGIKNRFPDTGLVVSCGDLPYYYLEFIISMLDVPLYFVRGNHASAVELGIGGKRDQPWGAVDLHRRAVRDESGVLLAGVEGSLRYNNGPHQYSQSDMWLHVFRLVPTLMLNRLRWGRYLDIFATHAPMQGVHDMPDLPHQGIKAFRWLVEVFQPVYHLHGHVHVYRPDTVTHSQVGRTQVVNVFGYRELTLGEKHSAPAAIRRTVGPLVEE